MTFCLPVVLSYTLVRLYMMAYKFMPTQSIKAREQQQQSQHQIQMKQLLLQKHAQQHPQEQQKQQQRSENTNFTTSAQNGTVAVDPPVRQNDTAASALSAKIYEDRMKITVQRDLSEEAFMKVFFSILLSTAASIFANLYTEYKMVCFIYNAAKAH